jgi:hypothetical protein
MNIAPTGRSDDGPDQPIADDTLDLAADEAPQFWRRSNSRRSPITSAGCTLDS